jgi:hypothetical protein
MPDSTLTDITVSTTLVTLGTFPIDKCLKKSLFVINQGTVPVTIGVSGSPTGITVTDFTSIKTGVAIYTQAQVDRHYIALPNMVVAANSNGCYDLTDYIYNFFRFTAITGSGTTTINYCLQKADSIQ